MKSWQVDEHSNAVEDNNAKVEDNNAKVDDNRDVTQDVTTNDNCDATAILKIDDYPDDHPHAPQESDAVETVKEEEVCLLPLDPARSEARVIQEVSKAPMETTSPEENALPVSHVQCEAQQLLSQMLSSTDEPSPPPYLTPHIAAEAKSLLADMFRQPQIIAEPTIPTHSSDSHLHASSSSRKGRSNSAAPSVAFYEGLRSSTLEPYPSDCRVGLGTEEVSLDIGAGATQSQQAGPGGTQSQPAKPAAKRHPVPTRGRRGRSVEIASGARLVPLNGRMPSFPSGWSTKPESPPNVLSLKSAGSRP